MGIDSLKIRGKLTKLAKTYFPFCKIQVIFNSGNRLGSFFQFKDKVPLNARSLILYDILERIYNEKVINVKENDVDEIET